MPERRKVLSLLAAGMGSGILASYVLRSSAENQPDARKQNLMIKTVSAEVSDESQFVASASIVTAAATAEQPASLDVALKWTGAESQEFVFGNAVPFSVPAYSTAGTPGLVLLGPHHRIERRTEDGWIPALGDDEEIPSEMNLTIYEFSPGESVSQRLQVWGDQRYVESIQPGTYRFETTFREGSPTSGSEQQTPGEGPRLGLTVELG